MEKDSSYGNPSIEDVCSDIEHLKGEFDVAIVILGGGLEKTESRYRNRTPWVTRMRGVAGAMLFHEYLGEGDNPVIIVSGAGVGGINSNLPTEASVMKSELIRKYEVPEDKIIIEEFSTDTAQNALFSNEILKALGFHEDGKVVLVTNGFHLSRAGRVFRGHSPVDIMPLGAEDIMRGYLRDKPQEGRLEHPYARFAKRYSDSLLNKKLIIIDRIILSITKMPGGQEFLTDLASSMRGKK